MAAFRDPAEVYADIAVQRAVEARRLEPELRAARNLRDAAIRSAVAAGATREQLRKVTGLSRAQVQRICDYSKDARFLCETCGAEGPRPGHAIYDCPGQSEHYSKDGGK